MEENAAVIKAAIAFLMSQQRSDGGYNGYSSPSPHTFMRRRLSHSIFPSAVMLIALSDVPGTQEIRNRLAAFLMNQKGDNWSWNFWMKDSPERKTTTYPDDLDDTACALAALTLHDRSMIGGEALAGFAKQLIEVEVVPGGPYRTWLIGPDAPTVWRDIDIVVNANIGYALALHETTLPKLEAYVTDAITTHELESPYYNRDSTTYYSLSRWYVGPAAIKLREVVEARLKRHSVLEPIELAQVITAAVRLGSDGGLVLAARRTLIKKAVNGSWPAAGFCFEHPASGGIQQYVGSRALTTALCLEALCCKPPADSAELSQTYVQPDVLEEAERFADLIPRSDLQREYHKAVQWLITGDTDGQVTAIAHRVSASLRGSQPSDALLTHLGCASLNGWLAYTLADDIVDTEEENAVGRLPVALVAMRQMLQHFDMALPDEPAYQKYVEYAVSITDGASMWELTHTRATVAGGYLTIPALPDYGTYDQLAERSWGHVLAPLGVLVASGRAVDSTASHNLLRFFRNFLIARQLHDDAHDWEDDLRRGHITAAVARLLKWRYGSAAISLTITSALEPLRTQFWDKEITAVVAEIRRHTRLAREAALANKEVLDPQLFLGWLVPLEKGADEAVNGSRQAKRFLRSFIQEDRSDRSRGEEGRLV